MLLEARNIERSFVSAGKIFTALAPMTLCVAASEFLVVTGRSGSGKSTLLNLLSGLDRPSHGLWNSILLTLSGAIWGVAVGMILALAIQKYAEWDVAFSSFSLIIAPLSAMFTGLVFGIHPAIRAASLEPALALRDS